ncbi:SPRY domain-containing protein 4-like [Polypterus senegalus]|uniref:SPRY domain-containing protein 4-like n=1 Tax=Polypterus senegalus TaxID=55291 RepID=UPI001962AD6B|nr:SPRY domain-containing protein 4-like [Polypterus senegalus]
MAACSRLLSLGIRVLAQRVPWQGHSWLQETAQLVRVRRHGACRFLAQLTPRNNIKFKLDEKTAHSSLELFKKDTGVLYYMLGVDPTKVPANPERFREWAVVFGDTAITTGRHYWEVSVCKSQEFRIGVADSDMSREDCVGTNNSSWVFGYTHRKWYAMTTNEMVPVSLVGKPDRVGLLLDYDGQKLALVDPEKQSIIHVMTANFKTPICPAFALWDGELVTHTGLQIPDSL